MVRRVGATTLVRSLALASCGGGAQFTEEPFDAVAQLRGSACGRPVVASAVVIRDELMLTAAHNVAGADGAFEVVFEDGTTFDATAVGFDIHRDVAFLSTPGMHRLPIRMRDPVAGDGGSVLRLRGDKRVEVPFTIGELVVAVGHDIYDDPSQVRRVNLRLDAPVVSGFSGAPVLSEAGELVGIVNARSRQSSLVYAVVTNEIRAAFAETDLDTEAVTERCVP